MTSAPYGRSPESRSHTELEDRGLTTVDPEGQRNLELAKFISGPEQGGPEKVVVSRVQKKRVPLLGPRTYYC